MTRVELTHTFPVSHIDAFAYITDTRNWKEFFPNFVRLRDPAHARWNSPGDEVTVVIRLLGREVEVNMTLQQLEKDTRVTYVSRQQGLPDASHERHFKSVPEGFEFRPVDGVPPLNRRVRRLLSEDRYDWLGSRAEIRSCRSIAGPGGDTQLYHGEPMEPERSAFTPALQPHVAVKRDRSRVCWEC